MKKTEKKSNFLSPLFGKIESLTKVQKILIYCITFILIIGLFVWRSFYPNFQKINAYKKEYKTLQDQLATAKKNAAQLSMYRKKMADAEAKFNVARKALPEKQEIPSLLASISQSGKDSGLNFSLFEPKPEVIKDFYAEIPVSIKFEGSYHNVAVFYDKVSRLSRVVNIRDIKMKPIKGIGNRLQTTCTAVTYKFVEAPLVQKKAPVKGKRKQ